MITTPYMVVGPEGGKHTLQCRTCGAKIHGDTADDAAKKFGFHDCRKTKAPREDFSQAAARIVREATENH